MESGDRILVAAGLTAAVVVGAFVLWGPGGAPRVRKRRGQIAGLQNLGRTCFLNTLLQALAACPAAVSWLQRHARPTQHNSMITTLYTVIEVVNGTHPSARGTPVCPLGVLQALKAQGWVVPLDQQDAHELLHVLLSCIEEETIAMAKKPGCLSDALGLSGGRAWSALASPASPPRCAPRADSTPPTPTNATRPRPASAAPAHEPDLVDPEPCEPLPLPCGLGSLSKGVSRSLCHLSGSRRWLPPAAPRTPPPPPFRGTLASRTQCTVCNTKSPIRYDKFDSVTLSLATASVGITGSYSLQGLLRAFTAPELVKGVRCERCCGPGGAGDDAASSPPQYTQHIRTLSFGKLPSCLCLHISRVEWVCGALTKRSEHVTFTEHLSLAPFTNTNNSASASANSTQNETELVSLLGGGGGVRSSLLAVRAPGGGGGSRGSGGADGGQYRLTAVVVHVGRARSGHFATYRRGNGFEGNRWWYTSDTLVHEVCLSEVLRCAAYLLFYERSSAASSARPLPRLDTASNGNNTDH